jgi:hypothetical protein
MVWKKHENLFNTPTIVFGMLLLLITIIENAMSAPIMGSIVGVWFLVLMVVFVSSLQMLKQAYLVFGAIAGIWFLFELVSIFGSQVGLANGSKMLVLLGYGMVMAYRYFTVK